MVLHPGDLHVAKYMVFFVLQLKNCFGFGGLIGNLCFRVVLSVKHLVSNIGYKVHDMLCSSV